MPTQRPSSKHSRFLSQFFTSTANPTPNPFDSPFQMSNSFFSVPTARGIQISSSPTWPSQSFYSGLPAPNLSLTGEKVMSLMGKPDHINSLTRNSLVLPKPRRTHSNTFAGPFRLSQPPYLLLPPPQLLSHPRSLPRLSKLNYSQREKYETLSHTSFESLHLLFRLLLIPPSVYLSNSHSSSFISRGP